MQIIKKIKKFISKYKIVTTEELEQLRNDANSYQDMYINDTDCLKNDNLDLEHRLDHILDKIEEIIKNKSLDKSNIIQRLKDLYRRNGGKIK